MFTSKMFTLDYSASNLLALCCGFWTGNSRSDRRDSRAENRDTQAKGSKPNPSLAGYDEIPGSHRDHVTRIKSPDSTYGTTDHVNAPETSGEAFQYEDDTSSDSDDEVLKRYQGLKSSDSFRSARSGRSGKRQPSPKTSEGNGDSACMAEQGTWVKQDLEQSSDEEEVNRLNSNHLDDATPLVPSSLSGKAVEESALSDLNPSVTSTAAGVEGLTYENRAFDATAVGASASLSGSEHGFSADRLSNDEHLFDVSDLQHDPPLISRCGSLEVTFAYNQSTCKMSITIHRTKEIPAKDRGGANSTQVRMMLLPSKKQRFKTKVKVGEDPVYDETFVFSKVKPEDIPGMGLRFRLYGVERMRRERMIGESVVGFASLNLEEPSTHWVVLEPRSNLSHGDSGFDVSSLSRSDSASSTQSLQHGGMPELLLGLAYSGTTGRLAVQIVKGSNFRNMAMNRAPDTYVKVTLMSPTGQELQRCKTSIRRGQPNPLFKETFMLQVALFQLPDVTLMISVYNKKSMKKKEMIGWFSLGQNSSGEEESSHWNDMRESKGEEVCRWHVLLES